MALHGSVLLGVILATLLVDVVQSQCDPSPCGINTICDVRIPGAATCRCKSGYNHRHGESTIDGCPLKIQRQNNVRNRIADAVITSSNFPQQSFNSLNPCSARTCGVNAICTPSGSRPVCSCPKGYEGDPSIECTQDPCKQDPCGQGADCVTRGTKAVCRCPVGRSGDPFVRCTSNPCEENPCGTNAQCRPSGNTAICECRPNYEGDPFVSCTLNPCLTDPCGINADCQNRRNQAVCNCREGYKPDPDPFVRCTKDPCYESPCGQNADCQENGNSAMCTCKDGYIGDPYTGCTFEPCSQNRCGRNAECSSRGRSATCRCPRGYSGDPYVNCILDPCSNEPCGVNAICENEGNSAICTCPQGHVGDPYTSCRFDPCANNPCGLNTECTATGRSNICRCLRGFTGSPFQRSGCRADPCSASDPCGQNAICENQGGRPTCRCPDGHTGDPFTKCIRGDCTSNSECRQDEACENYRCVDPCQRTCGQGADCTPQNHVAICRCPKGLTGNPFESCRRFTRSEICTACGANTDCEVVGDDTPSCKCKEGYIGNPLNGCRRECERNFDCSPSQECVNFKCTSVCREGACGEFATCVARNNRAECTCPTDFLGDARTRCYTECTKHNECSQNQACVKFSCKDPCKEPDPNVCGVGADCNVRNHKPICSCPQGFTGDPFVSCRKYTRADLCTPNICGDGARCQPGKDRNGADRPVCTCDSGFKGDPLIRCVRGECEHDGECRNDQACFDFQCVDPCVDGCGQGAQCRARNHAAICSCPAGFVGNALQACRPTRRGNINRGFSRFRRSLEYLLQ